MNIFIKTQLKKKFGLLLERETDLSYILECMGLDILRQIYSEGELNHMFKQNNVKILDNDDVQNKLQQMDETLEAVKSEMYSNKDKDTVENNPLQFNLDKKKDDSQTILREHMNKHLISCQYCGTIHKDLKRKYTTISGNENPKREICNHCGKEFVVYEIVKREWRTFKGEEVIETPQTNFKTIEHNEPKEGC